VAVQAVKALGGATSSAITTTTGATLFACFSGGDGGVYAPSDSKGNSWGSPVVNVTGGGARLAIYIVQNATVGSGHTFQFSGANGDTVGLFGEVSGVLAASLDAAATAGGQGAEPFTLNAASSLAQADNTILAFMFPYASGDPITYQANTGYTIHAQENNNNVYYGSAVASKVVSSTSAPSVQWDMSTSGDIFAGILALKMSGGGGGGIDGAGNIASGQAIGAPTIGAGVTSTGIATGQAIGSASIGAAVAAAGIATGQALGSPAVGAGINPAGIASAAAIGGPTIGASIVATGIATGEAVGAPTVGGGVVAAGIPSAAAVGAPSLAAGISAAGIPTGEAVGQPVVAGTGVFAAGIPSAAAVGQPALGAAIVAAGIASGEAVGNPTVGDAPEPPASSAGGFEMGGGRRVREVYRKPLLQRILDARYPRVKPRGERAQKRAKAIENEGADLVLEGSPTFADLEELAAQWMAQGPVMPSGPVDPLAVYLAQVAFRLRQRQAEIEAAALRQRQDEEAILVLLLA
jgi:hypothetical protein